MKLAFVVAVARNGVIGRNNALPWHLPEDMKFFKRVTMGKPVLMGRRTWESIGRPLPGRSNIVITHQEDYEAEGIKVVNSLQEARTLAEHIAEIDGVEEAAIIGGAFIFAEALPITDRMYYTEVHADVEGDVYFPEFDRDEWKEVERQDFKAQGPNPYDYSFVILDRKS
jgi:dihydrofolate reductase